MELFFGYKKSRFCQRQFISVFDIQPSCGALGTLLHFGILWITVKYWIVIQ